MKAVIALLIGCLATPAFADVACFQAQDGNVYCVNRGPDINTSASVLNGPANLAAQIQQQQLIQAQIELLRQQAEALRRQQEEK